MCLQAYIKANLSAARFHTGAKVILTFPPGPLLPQPRQSSGTAPTASEAQVHTPLEQNL